MLCITKGLWEQVRLYVHGGCSGLSYWLPGLSLDNNHTTTDSVLMIDSIKAPDSLICLVFVMLDGKAPSPVPMVRDGTQGPHCKCPTTALYPGIWFSFLTSSFFPVTTPFSRPHLPLSLPSPYSLLASFETGSSSLTV